MSAPAAKSFDVAAVGFGDVEADGGKVGVPLSPPVRVVTGACTLTFDPVDAGTTVPFLGVKPGAEDLAFFRAFERRIAGAAVEHPEWFGKGVSADQIRDSHKTFVTADGTVKLRLPTATPAFDDRGEPIPLDRLKRGDPVRLLLQAKAVRLGRSEFGCVWTVCQMRAEPKITCLIDAPVAEDYDDDDHGCFV